MVAEMVTALDEVTKPRSMEHQAWVNNDWKRCEQGVYGT